MSFVKHFPNFLGQSSELLVGLEFFFFAKFDFRGGFKTLKLPEIVFKTNLFIFIHSVHNNNTLLKSYNTD